MYKYNYMCYNINIIEVIILLSKYIKNSALIRDFNQGKASKYFNKVHNEKEPLRITRNGIDYVVVLDFQQYIDLIDKIEKIEGSVKMSEQTIQNDLYSYNVSILDKYECLNLGATTIRNLMSSKKLENIMFRIMLWIKNLMFL